MRHLILTLLLLCSNGAISQEEQIEFLYLGYTLAELEAEGRDSIVDKYQRATDRRPTLSDCLAVGDQATDTYELTWDTFTNLDEFEVCLFWLAAELDNADAFEAWLEGIGATGVTKFQTVLPSGLRDQRDQFGSRNPCTGISAGWYADDIPLDLSWYYMWGVYRLNFGVEYCGEYGPVLTSAGLTRK